MFKKKWPWLYIISLAVLFAVGYYCSTSITEWYHGLAQAAQNDTLTGLVVGAIFGAVLGICAALFKVSRRVDMSLGAITFVLYSLSCGLLSGVILYLTFLTLYFALLFPMRWIMEAKKNRKLQSSATA